MPYKTNKELPESVRVGLPDAAQSIFRNVFNSVSGKGANEASAMQQAWGAVKNAGYKKGSDGKWSKVGKSIDDSLEYVLSTFNLETIEKFFSSDEGQTAITAIIKEVEDIAAGGKIIKVDQDERLVFGFFNINKIGDNLVEDLQEDSIPTAELEKSAYDFVLNARVAGENHIRKGVGRLVESVVFTYEKQRSIVECLAKMGIEASLDLKCEAWFGGFKIDDDQVWKSIKEGDYPSFSIGGKGVRVPVE